MLFAPADPSPRCTPGDPPLIPGVMSYLPVEQAVVLRNFSPWDAGSSLQEACRFAGARDHGVGVVAIGDAAPCFLGGVGDGLQSGGDSTTMADWGGQGLPR